MDLKLHIHTHSLQLATILPWVTVFTMGVWATLLDSSMPRTQPHLSPPTPSLPSPMERERKGEQAGRMARRTLRKAARLSPGLRSPSWRRHSKRRSTSRLPRGRGWRSDFRSRRARSRFGSRIGAPSAVGPLGRKAALVASSLPPPPPPIHPTCVL